MSANSLLMMVLFVFVLSALIIPLLMLIVLFIEATFGDPDDLLLHQEDYEPTNDKH